MSSVFHYEFVFIHPFRDGNGRMARLWQTAILNQRNPVFQYIPIESRIHEFQSEYYDAIARCHKEGRSDIFIEFMLEKIDETLAMVLQHTAASDHDSQYVSRLLAAMEYNIPYTVPQLLEHLGLKSKETLRRHYLAPRLGVRAYRNDDPGQAHQP